MIAAVVTTVGVSIVAVEAARVVHVERLRRRVGVDDMVRARRVRVIHGRRMVVAMVAGRRGHPIGGRVLVAGGRGHLLLGGASCHSRRRRRRQGARRSGSHLGHAGRVRACGRVVQSAAAAVGHVGHMGLGAGFGADQRARLVVSLGWPY